MAELHAKARASLALGAEARREAEHYRERGVGVDDVDGEARVRAHDHTAALGDEAHHVADIVVRRSYVH